MFQKNSSTCRASAAKRTCRGKERIEIVTVESTRTPSTTRAEPVTRTYLEEQLGLPAPRRRVLGAEHHAVLRGAQGVLVHRGPRGQRLLWLIFGGLRLVLNGGGVVGFGWWWDGKTGPVDPPDPPSRLPRYTTLHERHACVPTEKGRLTSVPPSRRSRKP